jgi:Arc/MetJ-type ribon-helix-helix transcriptional regulator
LRKLKAGDFRQKAEDGERVAEGVVTGSDASGTVERGSGTMIIEITSSDVEALIRQHMQSGFFKSPEDLIRAVLSRSQPETRTGADLVAALQSCPYPKVEIEPSRVPSPVVRNVPL